MKNKTVYVLGAGFSKSAKAPLQSEIIKEIMELSISELEIEYKDIYSEYLERFKIFMERTFFVSESHLKTVSLEDIYTPLDRCILDNASYKNIEPKELVEIRKTISGLIVIMMHHKLYEHKLNLEHINKFAKYLVSKRSKHYSTDPFSILSTNWDIILDNALKSIIPNNEGVVDYCCYITNYKDGERLIPGLLARGRKMYNLKVLKLHGSINWLQCTRCQRLYVTFEKIAALDEFIKAPKCRLCEKNFHSAGSTDGGGALTRQLIMPTFLKDLNNVQIKLIWQNAGVELSEANKIIFMGYSFPMADFELRQLLSRFVRHNADIEVILHDKDKPQCGYEEFTPEFRYKNFFGKRNINFCYDGVEKYINDNYNIS